MSQPAAAPFTPPAIPWLDPVDLGPVDLGPGLDQDQLQNGLQAICGRSEVQAVLAFGSRGRSQAESESDLDLAVICREPQLSAAQRTARFDAYRQLLGNVGCDVDLVLAGVQDANTLAGSRWHVMGDVAREGRVLYVAR